MSKLLLVLAMVLVQVQPWVAALPCEGDAVPTVGSHTVAGGHHTTPAEMHVTASQDSDCPTMSACAVTAPAVVPGMPDTIGIRPPNRGDLSLPTSYPAQAFLTPPFHPPSA